MLTAKKALLANNQLYIRLLGLDTFINKVRVDFDDAPPEYGFLKFYEISELTSEVTLTLVKPNSRGVVSKRPSPKDYLTGIKLDQVTLLPDDFDMRPSKLPQPDLCF
jgi:hypothetical protein